MFGWLKRTPVPPPTPAPPPTERELRVRWLCTLLDDANGVSFLQGVAGYAPDLLQHPDRVTAASLSRVQQSVGIQGYLTLIAAAPDELIEACDMQFRWRMARMINNSDPF